MNSLAPFICGLSIKFSYFKFRKNLSLKKGAMQDIKFKDYVCGNFP